MIKVQQTIEVYELDGKQETLSGMERSQIGIDSHWNRSAFIVLVINGHRYTVVGKDLQAAVENARNINRY